MIQARGSVINVIEFRNHESIKWEIRFRTHVISSPPLEIIFIVFLYFSRRLNIPKNSLTFQNFYSTMLKICVIDQVWHQRGWIILNWVDNVNWPPWRVYKADVSSVSPSSGRMTTVSLETYPFYCLTFADFFFLFFFCVLMDRDEIEVHKGQKEGG